MTFCRLTTHTSQMHAKAACRVGDMYYSGRGTFCSHGRAIEYYEKAARAGEPEALNSLGIMLEDGKGLDKCPELAEEFFKKAADMVRGSVKHLRPKDSQGKRHASVAPENGRSMCVIGDRAMRMPPSTWASYLDEGSR